MSIEKKLAITIEDVLFVAPGDVKPEDTVIENEAEKSRYMSLYVHNFEYLKKLWDQHKQNGPTKERTVCIKRSVKFKHE